MDKKLKDIIATLEKKIGAMFASDRTGHNMDHLQRTMRNAILLQKTEGGNLRVIVVSALLHDIHRIMTDDQSRFVSQKKVCQRLKNFFWA